MDAEVKPCFRCEGKPRLPKSSYCYDCHADIQREYRKRVDYNAQRRAKSPRRERLDRLNAGLCGDCGKNPRHKTPSDFYQRCLPCQRDWENARRRKKKAHQPSLRGTCQKCGKYMNSQRVMKGKGLCVACESGTQPKRQRNTTPTVKAYPSPQPKPIALETREDKKRRIIADILRYAKERKQHA